ncbi:MAG: outer membrane beta-barrel protein [Gammaproteobacteria bacterium]
MLLSLLNMHLRKIITCICVFISFGAATSNHVAAQELPTDIFLDSEKKPIKRKSIIIVRKRTEKQDAQGIKLGNFILSPSVSLTEYYDDNVYASSTDEKDDAVTIITPAVNLKSDWKQHEINVDAGLEVSRYAELAEENVNNGWLNFKGRYDVNKRHHMLLGLGYIRDHEDRASPDEISGDRPTKFVNSAVDIGYSGRYNNHYFRVILNTTRIDFDDIDSLGSVIDNDDRDRDENAVGFRYLYKYSPASAVFLNSVTDKRDYTQTIDNEGNERNSDGIRNSIGLEYVSSTTISRLSIGKLHREYQSTVFEDVDESYFDLQHTWKFFESSSLSFKAGRSIEETTLDNSPGYLFTDSSIRLNLPFSDNKGINIEAARATAEYYLINREDDYLDYGVGYMQKILENLSFSIDLHRAERDSNITGEDYKINQLFLRLKAVI